MPTPFCHLHMHTSYSLLDGTNQLDPLLSEIQALRQPAVAITDHGNLFGAIQFYTKAKALGVNPIIGCEAYMAPGSRLVKDKTLANNDYYHLILLAQNEIGYRNLIKLVSRSYLDGFYYKPRMDKDLLRQHHEGLIALSGCLTGEIPYLIGQGDLRGATAAAREFQDIFGPDRFYLEIQANGLDQQRTVNRGLIDLHNALGIPIVGTNDCHYLRKADAYPHDLMLCLQTGTTVRDPHRFRFHTDQLYVKSSEEMAAAFCEIPEAISNTNRIAEQCALELTLNTTYLPQYAVPPPHTRDSYLESLALEGLTSRLRERPSTSSRARYDVRLREELLTICTMGFAGYFLIVWDIIHFARSRGIPVGPGRGSAAGSLVAYALRITDLDPIPYNLLFERFLNPERVSLPDIDMDFCMDRRGEVIHYVREKYGSDHVAQIMTFGTLGAKAAIRDIGRVLDLPYADVDRIAKLIPNQLNITLQEALAQESRLRELRDSTPQMQDLFSTAQALEGTTRHASTHAAGLVISEAPLTDHVPLYQGTDHEIVTQYSMGDVEKVGLVKFDFLGLKTLTMIHQAVTMINASRPETPLQIDQIPLDDPDTFRLLGTGRTTGLFQLESSGMRDLLTSLKPDQFEDLIAIIALYRPGPMDLIPDFIGRKQGAVPIAYDWPALEPILKPTYGVMIYQEQVMAIAHTIAGFSLGQADLLRRAMGKKKPEEMERLKGQFIAGCITNHVPTVIAESIYQAVEKFAGYGFNKSHAAAYAVICYQTAYLKAHFPVEFMAALMTCDMGNTGKLMGYFSECRDRAIPVLPPDINESQKTFSVRHQSLRFGLAAIKNVGEQAVETVIAERQAHGPYHSLLNVCERVDLRLVNKRVLEGWIKVGVFDSTGATRAHLLSSLDTTMEHGALTAAHRQQGQTSLFGEDPVPTSSVGISGNGQLSGVPEWDQAQRLRYERELTGFYISAHPLERFRDALPALATDSCHTIDQNPDGHPATLCGIVSGIKPITTKKGETMAVMTLEDLTGTAELVVFPDLYLAGRDLLTQDQLIRVTGTIDRTDKGTKLHCTQLERLQEAHMSPRQHALLTVDLATATPQTLQQLQTIFRTFPGTSTIALRFRLSDGVEADTTHLPNLLLNLTAECLAELTQVLGKPAIQLSGPSVTPHRPPYSSL